MAGAVCGFAQTGNTVPAATPDPSKTASASGSRVHSSELDSKLMGRKMPYRVVLPAGYDAREEGSRRYQVVYLLHGLTGNFANWTNLTRLTEHSVNYKLIIVTPEGENGWYTDSATKATDKYESYIVKELIPEIDRLYRTENKREGRAIAGLSMGGYGAMKFGLKYPEMFVLAGSFSGALGAASITERDFPGAISRSIEAIFGPVGGDVRKGNDPFDLIRRASPEQIKAMPFFYIDCGTEDFLFQNNREFVSLLVEKKVPHEYRQLPGAHNWAYWDKQVKEFLRVADRTFSRPVSMGVTDQR